MTKLERFLEQKEEQELDVMITEQAEIVGAILGYGIAGVAIAFGGTLLAYAGVKATSAIVRLWKNIIYTAKNIGKRPSDVVNQVKNDPMVKKEKQEMERITNKHEENISDVINAIKEKEFDRAKEEFIALEPRYKNLPEVHRIIIKEIVKVLEEPPLYITSPGNKSYKSIKKILGIRIARAAAEATKLSIEQKLEE